MRIAIVGFGTAGSARLVGYRAVPDAQIVGVVDGFAVQRAKAAPLPAYASIADLLAEQEVDVIDICTPPASHQALSIQALTAGCHVICEKPVAVTAADALALAEVSRRTGRLLYPAHNYKFSPMMRLLTESMDKVAGLPAKALFRVERSTHAAGAADWLPDWRRDKAVAGGGILLDHGSHCVYMAMGLYGEEPSRVSATARWQSEGVDEAIDVRLEFEGGVADIQLSWVADERVNIYRIEGPDGTVEITNGLAVLDGRDGRHERELESPTGSGTHEEWLASMFADFATILALPGQWKAPLAEITATARVVEAAYTSARLNGTPVRP
jgi:predicted dehydrogenase